VGRGNERHNAFTFPARTIFIIPPIYSLFFHHKTNTQDHPNIVRLEEVYESHSEIYLVQEVCKGGELFDRLDEQPDYHYNEAQVCMCVYDCIMCVYLCVYMM
jgi:serine/threonine protein kinase